MIKRRRWFIGLFGVFGCLWASVMGYAEYPNSQFDAWVMFFLGYAALIHIATQTNPEAKENE